MVASTDLSPLPSADPWRRLMGFVYEAIILFGVTWFTGYAFSSLTSYQWQRGNLTMHHAFQIFTGLVWGLYFTWFWAKGRRTLPMKTLSLDIVNRQEQSLSSVQALLRYGIGVAFFLAALALAQKIHLSLALLVVLPFLWCFWDSQRRSLIDILAGTRLIIRPITLKQSRGLV